MSFSEHSVEYEIEIIQRRCIGTALKWKVEASGSSALLPCRRLVMVSFLRSGEAELHQTDQKAIKYDRTFLSLSVSQEWLVGTSSDWR